MTISGFSSDGTVASAAHSVAVVPLSPPAISPPSGTYQAPLVVSAPHFRSGVEVRYTLDGSVPDAGSSVLGVSLTLEYSSVFKTRAFATGMPPSETVEAAYFLTTQPAIVSPAGATFTGTQVVSIVSGTSMSLIRYTLDGSEPDKKSLLYGGPLTLDATAILKARVFRTGNEAGPVVTADFTRNGIAAAIPTISPAGGTFHAPPLVSLSSSTPGAVIRYTTDGRDVTASSPIYSGSFQLSQSATVKARTEAAGFAPGPVASAVFHLRSAWENQPLPAGQSLHERHDALGSDGHFLYFTSGNSTNAPFHRMPKNGGAWQSLTPLPIPAEINAGGVGDMGYLDGGLYIFARHGSSSLERALYRYDIASNSWARGGPMQDGGADTACVPLATDRILGGWIGWTRVKEVTDLTTGADTDRGDLSGGAAHPWDGSAGTTDAWFVKHQWLASQPGVFARIPRDGSPFLHEIPGLPFNPGIGCAIEAIPSDRFADQHERIFVLRGGQAPDDGDGGSWTGDTISNQLAIYDTVVGTWTMETLPFMIGEGSEMARVDDTVFILGSRNVAANPLRSFRLAPVVHPPFPENAKSLIQPAGAVNFHWQGNPGQAYALESSVDLVKWTLTKIIVADGQGDVFYHDAAVSQPVRLFHRISR